MKRITVLSLFAVASACAVGTATVASIGTEAISGIHAEGCTHANVIHHEAVAASIWECGTAEYWACCACHVSFKDAELTDAYENTNGLPTDPGDGRYIAPIGKGIASNATYDGVVSEEDIPNPIFSTVYEQPGKQGQFIFNNTFDVSSYSQIAFMIKAPVWFIVRSSWSTACDPNIWFDFNLTQAADNTWSIAYRKSNTGADFSEKYTGITGSTLKEITGFGGDAGTYYSTNIKGVKKDAPSGSLIANSTVDAYTDLNQYSEIRGFETVTKGTVTYNKDDQGKAFLSKVDIHQYSSVFFAFKTDNRKFAGGGTGWDVALATGKWFKCTIVNNGDGTYTSSVSDINGTAKFGYSNKNTFEEALPYYNYDGDNDELVWYSTELRGNKKPGASVEGTVIDSCALSANGVSTVASALEAPRGFETARDWVKNGNFHGKYYSGADLSGYSKVEFGIRQLNSGYFLFNGWTYLTESTIWMKVTLIQNADATWNITFKSFDGRLFYSEDNLGATLAEPGVYTNHSLNAILCGVPSTGYYSFAKGSNQLITVTEVRGIAK